MIVQPDFLDHWKTCLLVTLTNSESAILCVLRFWAHCQNRRQWEFEAMTPQILSAICRWTGDAQTFWDAMLQTFIEVDGKKLVAHDWRETNSSLIAAWQRGQYGKMGGRPKTLGKPVRFDAETLDKPEKRRVEKSREDKNTHSSSKNVGPNGSDPAAKNLIESLSLDPAYAGIDVPREYQKMVRWCKTNQKIPSERRFVNWLNRVERPMSLNLPAPKGTNVW
jgi:hypothetical protein